jgi:diguanylate cyclase (GGDEF)-like protein/hemerythrin-like metal-binding protein
MQQTFMRFPHPLALVTPQGHILLANAAWTARFDTGTVKLHDLSAVLPASAGEAAIEVAGNLSSLQAQVIRLSESLLVSIGAPPDPLLLSDLESMRQRVFDLERLAATDYLTGAWNRAHFERLMDAELARSAAMRQSVSLVLVDIDHFKQVNDTLGHGTGDAVLRELVRVLHDSLRASDILFRWGGEEFVVLVSSAGYRGAGKLAEKLRRTVAGHAFPGVGPVTISLGVAEHVGGEDMRSLFLRLDAALYNAKRAGRNCVFVDRRGDSDAWAAQRGVSTLQLTWHESYECGEPDIDREHVELFERANRVIVAASAADGNFTELRAQLESLLQHIRLHFANEESLLAQLRYADLENHRRSHAGLLTRAERLRVLAEQGQAGLGAVIEFVARDVVARHILAVDRAFYPLFDGGGREPTAQFAALDD